MVLISFSEPDHVKKILDGSKKQTTRQPRKSPIKVGDEAQLYYRSRMQKNCKNCIYGKCMYAVQGNSDFVYEIKCDQYTNFFGTGKIIKVEELDFTLLSPAALEAWAVANGFDSWKQANQWFSEKYDWKWAFTRWTVITWEPNWLKEEVIA